MYNFGQNYNIHFCIFNKKINSFAFEQMLHWSYFYPHCTVCSHKCSGVTDAVNLLQARQYWICWNNRANQGCI